MIPMQYIIEWRQQAPWIDDGHVEQDLVISRALVEMFSDKLLKNSLAFRGGTALHKMLLHPGARYSEDIDLVQAIPGPVGEVIGRIRNVLKVLGKPRVIQKHRNTTLIFTFYSETDVVRPMRLKVEINCREHQPVYSFQTSLFTIKSGWFSGECEIQTYSAEELLGSKLRALFQRSKGRDLFDLGYIMKNLQIDEQKIITVFKSLMNDENHVVTRADFEMNLQEKMKDTDFLGDIVSLVRPGIKYNLTEYELLVKENLLAHLK